MKKISVIMPVYNAEDTVGAAMDSILKQDAEFELLAIDDGSTDKSYQIMKEVAGENPRVRLISLPHKGAYHARNEGIRLAQGEYLYFADADDLVETGALKTMALRMEESGADLLTCGYREVRRKDGKEKLVTAEEAAFDGAQVRKDFTAYDANGSCKVLGSCFNKLFLTDKVKNQSSVRFPALQRNEEEAFLLRYLPLCEKIVNIPDIVYTFYPIDMARARVRLPENFAEEVEEFRKMRVAAAKNFSAWNEKTASWIAAEYWGKMMLALKLCYAEDGKIDKKGKERFRQVAELLMKGLHDTGSIPTKVSSSKIYKLLQAKLFIAARILIGRSV